MKNMSTIAWPIVKEWIAKNPYQSVKLPVYHGLEKATVKEEPVQSDGWTKRVITPSTPLSAVLMIQDDMYTAIPKTARHSQLRDETTDLQEKAALHLKGRQWPVRRTAEGIAAIGLEEERHSLWTPLGWRALCSLRECQIVVINEQLKTVQLYPEDVRLWSKDTPVYIMDSSAHTVFVPPQDYSLVKFLQKQESLGLAVEWPEMEGTMEEIKSAAHKVGESAERIVKATLQKKVGRAQSIHYLNTWSL